MGICGAELKLAAEHARGGLDAHALACQNDITHFSPPSAASSPNRHPMRLAHPFEDGCCVCQTRALLAAFIQA